MFGLKTVSPGQTRGLSLSSVFKGYEAIAFMDFLFCLDAKKKQKKSRTNKCSAVCPPTHKHSE